MEGFWLLHSHLGHHQSQGMALVLQEGDTEDMVPTPPNFPTCGSFQITKEQFEEVISDHEKILKARKAGKDFGKYSCIFRHFLTSYLIISSPFGHKHSYQNVKTQTRVVLYGNLGQNICYFTKKGIFLVYIRMI